VKRALLILVVLFVVRNALATEQVPDFLFYNDLKLRLFVDAHPSPLEIYYHQSNVENPFRATSTANYRGHIATWKIHGDRFYLTDIRGTPSKHKPHDFGVGSTNSPSVQNHEVWADWFSGILYCYLKNQPTSYLFHLQYGVVVDTQVITRHDGEMARDVSSNEDLSGRLRRMVDLWTNYMTYYNLLNVQDSITFKQHSGLIDTRAGKLSPIFLLYDSDHLKWPFNWENEERCATPHCQWVIKDDRLYLLRVQLCSGLSLFRIDTETLDLTALFPDKATDDGVWADWVTGVYVIKHGRVTKEDLYPFPFSNPGFKYTVFKVTGFTYVRITKGHLIESYTVTDDFDPGNPPEDVDLGLRRLLENHKLPRDCRSKSTIVRDSLGCNKFVNEYR